jgi:site-specific DNA-methyltransferase (adenine-specific)
MTQKSSISSIGIQLKNARKSAKLTQSNIAKTLNFSTPTIRQAEHGLGTYAGFIKITKELGLDLVGRNLKNKLDLGEGLKLLRRRQKISIRHLSAITGIHADTIKSIESNTAINFYPIERVATALGAGLLLHPSGVQLPFHTGIATSSNHQSWLTPPEFIELIYPIVNGKFDLDPASNGVGRQANIKADRHYTEDMDGLSLSWTAKTVWCNPPYSLTEEFVKKAHEEHQSGNAELIIMLIPARPEGGLWHRWIEGKANAFILRSRLRYYENGIRGSATPFPSAIIVFGGGSIELEAIKTAFPKALWIKK